jgi:hypothetical protein
MDDENYHEGNESEYVELRAIVAFDGHCDPDKPLL